MTPPDPPDPNRQFKEWIDQWNRLFIARASMGDRPTFQWEVPPSSFSAQQPEDDVRQQPTIHRAVTPEGDPILIIRAPYNAAFVGALKAEVDSGSRIYNSASKTWTVDAAYEKLVRGLVDRHFGKQRRPDSSPNPSPRGVSDMILEQKVYPVRAAPEPTVEGLTAEVSRLTYELETERQRRATAEQQAKRSAEEAYRARGQRDAFERGLGHANARAEILEREVDRLTRANRSSIFGGPSHFDGSAPSPRLSDAYWVLGVTADLPLEIVEVVWRRLASRHHPDVGGDPERMKQINSAMDQIRAAKQRQQN